MFKSNGEFWHTNTNALSNLDPQEIGKIGGRSNLRRLGARSPTRTRIGHSSPACTLFMLLRETAGAASRASDKWCGVFGDF